MTREEILAAHSGQIDAAVEQMIQCGAVAREQAAAEKDRIISLLQRVYDGSASEEQRIEASAILAGRACSGEKAPVQTPAASGFGQIAALAVAAFLLWLLLSGGSGEDEDDYFDGPKPWRF